MKLLPCLAFAALVSGPAIAEDARQLDAHEHGVGKLDIAFEGNQVAMEFHAPGADIVGFEYVAESAEDRAATDGAIESLSRPLRLFALPEAAGCSAAQVAVELESEKEHEGGAGHTEFHTEYLLTCADPSAISSITFAYFDAFPSALEVEVQVISDSGAKSFEVERAMPILDLHGMF